MLPKPNGLSEQSGAETSRIYLISKKVYEKGSNRLSMKVLGKVLHSRGKTRHLGTVQLARIRNKLVPTTCFTFDFEYSGQQVVHSILNCTCSAAFDRCGTFDRAIISCCNITLLFPHRPSPCLSRTLYSTHSFLFTRYHPLRPTRRTRHGC
jgi:hypothetical protein